MMTHIRELIGDVTPKDRRGRVLLLVSFIIVATFYVFRLLNQNLVFGTGLGRGFLMLMLLPFIGFFLLFVLYHGIVTLAYKRQHRGNLSPFLLVAIGVPLALFLPTPPTMSEVNFWMHQSRYEQLVQLARQEELPSSPQCGRVFAPPTGYEQFAKDCIFVRTDPTLIVEFTPDGFYRPIVYFEDPMQLTSGFTACNGDGSVFRKMRHNWYICNRDPN